jgi:hypothetical protein
MKDCWKTCCSGHQQEEEDEELGEEELQEDYKDEILRLII